MSRPTLGTYAWARQTGGRLSAADRLRLTTQGVLLQLQRIPRSLRRQLGMPSASVPLDLEPLEAPDSAMAKVAEKAVAAVSSEPLVHHVYRSYAWGQVLATRAGLRLDRELFYIAALLHDLGLADIEPAPGSCCFAYDGAYAALQTLTEAGMEPERAETIADAIALHLNVQVGLEHGPEAHILNQATALDVIGLGLSRIPKKHRQQVLAQHPRDGWNEQVLPTLGHQVRSRPDSRIAFLTQRFGFGKRAASARF